MRYAAHACAVAVLATILVVAPSHGAVGPAAFTPCGGVGIPLDISIDATPVASLVVGGRRGNFLIDTGATKSSVDAESYGLAPGDRVELDTDLPELGRVPFVAEDMRAYRAPPGGQHGRIGTDILTRYAVGFLYGAGGAVMTARVGACDAAALREAGYAEIGAPAPGGSERPNNVPVVGLALGPVDAPAQLDTGFAERAEPELMQGNKPLFTALRAAGVSMAAASAGATRGCRGVRMDERWRIDSTWLTVRTAEGGSARTHPPPLLEIKGDVDCGGISGFASPYAQLGASWLGRWGATIVDFPAGTVWIARPPAPESPAWNDRNILAP